MAETMPGVRVLVCGGRDFDDGELVRRALDALAVLRPFELLIEGGATGADSLARNWALRCGVPVATEVALWHEHGRAAGPRRNQKMLDTYKPDVVAAFPGGTGTADMIARATKSGVPVIQFAAVSPQEGKRDA